MILDPTAGGLDFLSRCLAGGPSPVFSKVSYGNGTDATSKATKMSNRLIDIEITAIERTGSFVELTAVLNNAEIEDGFNATELGVFIQNPEDENEHILFAYGYDDPEEATYIPAATKHAFETTEKVMVFVGATENVSAVISESMTFVTKDDFEKHIQDKNNPHEVTAKQVGLGNVPNVTTNDQTPTFTMSEKEEELVSGENLSTLLGKIAKIVKSFIEHIANKSNPHEVTADQTGAAKAKHVHSAKDITTGVLNVERGGTGVSSMRALATNIEPYLGFPVIGTYKGNDAAVRKIELDFTPSAVLVINSKAQFGDFEGTYGGFATKEHDAVASATGNTVVQITSNGFFVYYKPLASQQTNNENHVYHFIAYK